MIMKKQELSWQLQQSRHITRLSLIGGFHRYSLSLATLLSNLAFLWVNWTTDTEACCWSGSGNTKTISLPLGPLVLPNSVSSSYFHKFIHFCLGNQKYPHLQQSHHPLFDQFFVLQLFSPLIFRFQLNFFPYIFISKLIFPWPFPHTTGVSRKIF